MDEETKNKIFEPYFSTKEAGDGTGLGLAVVHGIVKSHNGAITLYSEPGQGTTFHIYFPKATEEPIQLTESHKEPLTGGSERIMLVDDEKDILVSTQEALEKFGYSVEVFSNGVQAFQVFKAQPDQFDAVITDMTMPYMTGTELARKLIEIKSTIPIILCTGYSQIIHKEKAYAMGITKYLEKPVPLEDLIRSIQNVFSDKSVR